MRVVLSGYYGFHNVGDEAILQAIINALKNVSPDIEITVLSNDPDYTKQTYHVDAVNRWKIGEIISAIKQADGVISGGGSLLQDKTSMKSVPYYTAIMMIARYLRKPFFVYAQGIGPLEKTMSRKLVKLALSKATYISVRDQDSLDLLRRIKVENPIDIVPDPVMGMKYETELNKEWLEREGTSKNFITVAIRDWPTQTNFKKKTIEALERCLENRQNIIFVPMHGEADDVTAREWQAKLNGYAAIFPYHATIEEKIAIIGNSKLLIGMRLHALIFAAIAKTPMIGISYDPKIDSFMNQIEQPMIGAVDGDWTSDQLYDLIQNHLQNHSTQVNQLQEKSMPLQAKANETAKIVIAHLGQ